MVEAVAPVRQRIKWMWKSNDNPWSTTEADEWRSYSDVETAIIEEAFQKKLSEAVLDDYHIKFKHSVQISNLNKNNQRPVKRMINEKDEVTLREDRFMSNPVSPSSLCTNIVAMERFFVNVDTYYKCSDVEDDTIRRMFVEKAAEGLIYEGKILGRQKEGEWMAQQLLNVKNGSPQEVWECCVRLYCMESFLYKKMNEYMRLVTEDQHEALWRSKVPTYGPFAVLLSSPFYLTTQPSCGIITVYRGANLSNEMIDQYRQKCADVSVAQNPTDHCIIFPAFTSTSRNQERAERFGNVLFIIKTGSLGYDVTSFSNYDEEEILLLPDCMFIVSSCTFDATKKKWIIYLTPPRIHKN